jgi:hypothetical protein
MIKRRRLQPNDDLPRGWRWIGPVTPDEPVESVSFEDQSAHGTAPFQAQRVAGAAITRLWFPPRWVVTGGPPATANPSVLAAKIFVLHFIDCTLPKQRPGTHDSEVYPRGPLASNKPLEGFGDLSEHCCSVGRCAPARSWIEDRRQDQNDDAFTVMGPQCD